MKIKQVTATIGLLLILSALQLGCVTRIYKHTAKDGKTEAKMKNSLYAQWRMMESNNHIVIHVGQEMQEIYAIRYDEATDSIRANFRPFEGAPMASYYKVLEKRSRTALRSSGTYGNDIRQVHLFINEYEKLNVAELSFAAKDIFQVDVSENAVFLNALATTGVVVGSAALGLTAFILIVCNCPHVYIDNGDGLEYNNTLFTGAKASQLERFDYKELPDYFPTSSGFTIQIKNEDKEDQFTNLVEVISVMHPKGIEVVADKNGEIHTLQKLEGPISATDNTNTSVLPYLEARDDYAYRFNPLTFDDLAEVALTFDAKRQSTDAKLVIRARNTMWSGYVYDEFNKLFGKNHGKWVEMNKDKSKEEREKWMREQGIKLLVDIKQNGEWVTIDEVEVVGDPSHNQVVIPIQRSLFGEELEVRLRSGFMFWELDCVGVDFSENKAVEVQVHKPAKATGNNGADFTQQLSFDDNDYMQHALHEDLNSTEVNYENLPVDSNLQRTLILKSKGYYVPKSEYTGKTDRKRLQSFVNPGELSRFSRDLYDNVMQEMVAK
jgi:hypothetical protein